MGYFYDLGLFLVSIEKFPKGLPVWSSFYFKINMKVNFFEDQNKYIVLAYNKSTCYHVYSYWTINKGQPTATGVLFTTYVKTNLHGNE